MLPRSRARTFTLLDAVILAVLAAAALYVVHRVRSGLVYTWRWSAIPQFLLRRSAESGRLTPGTLLLGLFTTIRLSIWSALGGLTIGVFAGMLRIAKNRAVRAVGRIYVELVRNTPPLVLVFIFFYFIANQVSTTVGIDAWVRGADPVTRRLIAWVFSEPARFPEFLSAVVTMSIYEGAYMAEIIRAGIQSVHPGQAEAAYAIGLSRADQYRFVILPQAFRTILPALAGQFISTVKDSAIVAVISVQELTFRGLELMSATYRTFEIWITITALYFLLTGGLSLAARLVERRRR